MADILFSVGDLTPRLCPTISKCVFQPGLVEYSYLDGSFVYLGSPQYTLQWDFLDSVDAAAIWEIYRSQMTNVGNYISVCVPDYTNGGWRVIKAFITMPQGIMGGDLVQDFRFTVYNPHEDNLRAAGVGGPDLWQNMENGSNLIIGSGTYPENVGWEF